MREVLKKLREKHENIGFIIGERNVIKRVKDILDSEIEAAKALEKIRQELELQETAVDNLYRSMIDDK